MKDNVFSKGRRVARGPLDSELVEDMERLCVDEKPSLGRDVDVEVVGV